MGLSQYKTISSFTNVLIVLISYYTSERQINIFEHLVLFPIYLLREIKYSFNSIVTFI